MWSIAINDSGVFQSVIWAAVQQTAEWIDVLFWAETPGDPRNIVIDGGPHPTTARGRGFNAAFAKLLWLFVSKVSACMLYAHKIALLWGSTAKFLFRLECTLWRQLHDRLTLADSSEIFYFDPHKFICTPIFEILKNKAHKIYWRLLFNGLYKFPFDRYCNLCVLCVTYRRNCELGLTLSKMYHNQYLTKRVNVHTHEFYLNRQSE